MTCIEVHDLEVSSVNAACIDDIREQDTAVVGVEVAERIVCYCAVSGSDVIFACVVANGIVRGAKLVAACIVACYVAVLIESHVSVNALFAGGNAADSVVKLPDEVVRVASPPDTAAPAVFAAACGVTSVTPCASVFAPVGVPLPYFAAVCVAGEITNFGRKFAGNVNVNFYGSLDRRGIVVVSAEVESLVRVAAALGRELERPGGAVCQLILRAVLGNREDTYHARRVGRVGKVVTILLRSGVAVVAVLHIREACRKVVGGDIALRRGKVVGRGIARCQQS